MKSETKMKLSGFERSLAETNAELVAATELAAVKSAIAERLSASSSDESAATLSENAARKKPRRRRSGRARREARGAPRQNS